MSLDATTIALFALIGPALVMLGIWLGTLRASTRAAHKRLDDLETLLREEFRNFRLDLRESIEKAWTNCPLAHKHKED